MDLRLILAKNMRRLRKKRGVTQQKFAVLSKVDRSYLNKIENGHKWPSLPIFKRIARTLRVEPWILLVKPKDKRR